MKKIIKYVKAGIVEETKDYNKEELDKIYQSHFLISAPPQKNYISWTLLILEDSDETVLNEIVVKSSEERDNDKLYYYYYKLEHGKLIEDREATQKDHKELFNLFHACAYNTLGDKLYDNEEYKKALDEYTKAAELDPNCGLYYCNKAITLGKLTRYDEAIREADKALSLNQNIDIATIAKSNALNSQGNKLFHEEKYEEALMKFTNASNLIPNDKIYLGNKAITLNKLERYDEAIIESNKALALDPNYEFAKTNKANALSWKEAHSLNLHGDKLFYEGKYKEALVKFAKACSLNPNHKIYLGNKAITLNKLERYDEAIIESNKALALDPNYEFAKANKVNALNGQVNKLLNERKYNEALIKSIDVANLNFNEEVYNEKQITNRKERDKQNINFNPQKEIKVMKQYKISEVLGRVKFFDMGQVSEDSSHDQTIREISKRIRDGNDYLDTVLTVNNFFHYFCLKLSIYIVFTFLLKGVLFLRTP